MVVRSPILRIAILACLGLAACLPSDPGRERNVQVVEPDTKPLVQNTSPEFLSKDILSNRSFSESPDLAKQASRGLLPPVSERLPRKPLVIRPLRETGLYGGSIRRALTGDIVQTAGPSKAMGENLMSFTRPMPTGLEYSLADTHFFIGDGRVAVFKIREGVKWSDGHPFTVDDILFWYYDFQLDENARDNAIPPTAWMVDGEPIKMEKVNDITLRIESPYPLGPGPARVYDNQFRAAEALFFKMASALYAGSELCHVAGQHHERPAAVPSRDAYTLSLVAREMGAGPKTHL